MCIQMIYKVSPTESETYKKALSHNFLLSVYLEQIPQAFGLYKTIKEAPSKEGAQKIKS